MKNSGFSSVFILVVAVVIILVTFALYYSSQSGTDYDSVFNQNTSQPTPSTGPETVEEDVSDMDDEETLDAELDATVISNPEDDFSDLEQQASEL